MLTEYFDSESFYKATGLQGVFGAYPMKPAPEDDIEPNLTPVNSDGRAEAWDKCWASQSDMRPPYLTGQDVLRINGRYLKTSADFMPAFQKELVCALARKHFNGQIVELGCGGGFNLVSLGRAGFGPLRGYDRSVSAVNAAQEFASRFGIPVQVYPCGDLRFDCSRIELEPCVLTCGFMEQLGKDWKAVLDRLLSKPCTVVHIEPFEEMYDGEDLFDYAALQYHRARGYLSGYLTHLRKVAKIIDEKRVHVGSRWNDGYSYVVWRNHG